jgi:putative ABC transport system permease protein
MKTPLAWRNVAHSRVRSVVALLGVSFAILLIFMQLGFRAAARSSATNVYEALDFDLLVLSRQYVFLAQSGDFPRARLEELRAVEGVASFKPLWIGLGEWRSQESRERWNVLTLGVEPASRPFRSPAVNDQLPKLSVFGNVLADSLSRPEHGPMRPGIRSEVQHRQVEVVGQYGIGAGFIAGATLVAGRETFLSLFRGSASADRVSAGLIKLTPGASPSLVAGEINRRLMPVATALTRNDVARAEETFWLEIKPIGIMFTSGVLVAFVVGAVILYQVLASEVQNHLREYATLKALGYGDRSIYSLVLTQALIFAGLGFIPAFFLSIGLYHLLRTHALVPVAMEPERAVGVLLLTLAMCLSSTFLAVLKLRAADPADLF